MKVLQNFIMIALLSLSSASLAQQNQDSREYRVYLPNGQWHSPYLPNGEYSPYLDFSLEYLERIGALEIQETSASSYVDFYNPNVDMTFHPTSLLELVSIYASSITYREILGSSRDFRYQGGLTKTFFQPPLLAIDPTKPYLYVTVNYLADTFNLNNMERLEFLKYLLDAGFVPLPPYIDFTNYFQIENADNQTLFRSSSNDANVIYPTTTAIARLQDICLRRSWPWSSKLNSSPTSFIRLALFNTLAMPESRNSSSRFIEYDFIKSLFEIFSENIPVPGGYRPEDFTYNDLRILGQFVRDMGYIPGWPDRYTQRRSIKDVTDETFQTEVIEASKDRPVLVYFYVSKCDHNHCLNSEAAIESLAIEIEEERWDDRISIARVFVIGNPETAEMLSVKRYPVFMIYYDGERVNERRGTPVFSFSKKVGMKTIIDHLMDTQEILSYIVKELLKSTLINPVVDLHNQRQ